MRLFLPLLMEDPTDNEIKLWQMIRGLARALQGQGGPFAGWPHPDDLADACGLGTLLHIGSFGQITPVPGGLVGMDLENRRVGINTCTPLYTLDIHSNECGSNVLALRGSQIDIDIDSFPVFSSSPKTRIRQSLSATTGGKLAFYTADTSSVLQSRLELDEEGKATFNYGLALAGDITPAQITGNQNNYNPTGLAGAAVLRLDASAAWNITGLAGGADGRVIVVHNVGANAITLTDEDAGSTAANRFALSADLTLSTDDAVMLQYDSTSARWRSFRASADHGTLLGLGDDDHPQYLLLAGRAGGQIAQGGTAASENLDLHSTAHATKGLVRIDAGGGFGGYTPHASTRFLVSKTDAGNSDCAVSIIGKSVGEGSAGIYLGKDTDPDYGWIVHDLGDGHLEINWGGNTGVPQIYLTADNPAKFGFNSSSGSGPTYLFEIGLPANGIWGNLALVASAFGPWFNRLEWRVSSSGADAEGELRYIGVTGNAETEIWHVAKTHFMLGVTTAPTAGTKAFILGQGTALSGMPLDSAGLQAKDVGGTAQLFAVNEAGTAQQLTGSDPYTQYALLAGRAGGQNLTGGTAAGEDLTFTSTSNATKGQFFMDTASDGGSGAKLSVASAGIYTAGNVSGGGGFWFTLSDRITREGVGGSLYLRVSGLVGYQIGLNGPILGSVNFNTFKILSGFDGVSIGELMAKTIIGGSGAGDDLRLQSTSNATKGNIFFGSTNNYNFDEVNNRLTLGAFTGAVNGPLQIQIDGAGTGFVVSNSASEYTRFISGGVAKGLIGTGTVVFTLQNDGDIKFAPGGSDRFYLERTSRSLIIGLSAASTDKPAVGTDAVIFKQGTALSSLAANTAGIQAVDNSGTADIYAVNEAGATRRLTGTDPFTEYALLAGRSGQFLDMRGSGGDAGVQTPSGTSQVFRAKRVYDTAPAAQAIVQNVLSDIFTRHADVSSSEISAGTFFNTADAGTPPASLPRQYGIDIGVLKGTGQPDGDMIGLEITIAKAPALSTKVNYGVSVRSADLGGITATRAGTAVRIEGARGWTNGIDYIDTDNSSVLFRVDQSGKVGIGVAASANIPLHIQRDEASVVLLDAQGTSAAFRIDNYTAAPSIAFVGRAARGTRSLATAIQSGDTLFKLAGRGHDGSAFSNDTAVIALVAEETFTGSALGSRIDLYTVPIGSTTSTLRMQLTANGNQVMGTQAALATTATDGFLYIPSCAGTPTGTPTAYTGKIPLVYDSTNNILYAYSNGAWRAH